MHGQDGWELWKYDWNEGNGVATIVYKRKLEDGTDERKVIEKSQPLWPGHVGYKRQN